MGLISPIWRRRRRSAINPVAAAYIAAVEAADGQPLEPYIKIAISAFIVGCMADASPNAGVSNWDAMKTGCLMAGPRTLAGALIPFKGIAPTNVNLTSADYFRSIGLVGTVTGYINSNRLTDADPQDNQSMGVWITNPGTTGSFGLIGANATSTSGSTRIGENSTAMFYRCRTSNPNSSTGANATTGLIAASRNSAADYTQARGNNNFLSVAENSQTLTSSTIFVTRVNGGSGDPNPTRRYSFYWIGEAVDLQLLNNRLQTYMNAVSVALEPETQTYVNNIAANGGSISSAFAQSVNNFVIDTMIDGTWPKLSEVGIFAGVDNLNAALVKLKAYPGSPSKFTNNNFVNGDYNASGAAAGLLGNGSTKYLDGGWLVNGLTVASSHLGAYNTVASSAGNKACAGAFASVGSTYFVRSTQAGDATDFSLGVITGGNNGARVGYTLGSNQAGTLTGVVNNASVFSAATAGAYPALNNFVFAVNFAGSPSNFYDGRQTFHHAGTGLTPAEDLTLAARINTLMTSIGANTY